jgi:hypothetical protein
MKTNQFWIGLFIGLVLAMLYFQIKNQPDKSANFEAWKGTGVDFLLNKKTGEVWRYYKNESNSIPLEGFVPMSIGAPNFIK